MAIIEIITIIIKIERIWLGYRYTLRRKSLISELLMNIDKLIINAFISLMNIDKLTPNI